LAHRLRQAGIEPWLDAWSLSPGDRWQEAIAFGLAESSACAVFIGPNDLGAWEREELALASDRAAKDRDFRLFLVLLPGLAEQFDAAALTPFLSTRTWVDLRGGIEDSRAFQALINGIKGVPLGPELPLEPSDDVCPYRGLQSFEEQHADLFFGRDAEIQRLVEKLKGNPFLAVLGPSGSGKSSVVLAGLIPALRRGAIPGSEDWAIRVLKPGANPLDVLCGHVVALRPDASAPRVRDDLARDPRTLRLITAATDHRVVWVVDQFEEVFSLCKDEDERAAFIANLLYAAPNAVVITMRADFYIRCAAHPELAQQMAAHQALIGPMSEESLRQAVDEPARRVGLRFEAGLIDTVLEDVAAQPGALPLLEHALLELWERRRGGLLTLEAYRETGGVAGALAKRAEATFADFTPDQQEIARRAFLRLTQPGEGTEDTRRRARVSELVTAPGQDDEVDSVIRGLVATRMLTAGGGGDGDGRWVDVSHEALIRGWPRLRGWLDEDRAGLRIHRRVTEAADDWVDHHRDDGLLFRGARLAEALEWRARAADALNEREREFLDAAAALQERERAEAEERRAREIVEAERLDRATRRAWRLRLAFVLGICVAATIPALSTGRPDRSLDTELVNARLDTAGLAPPRNNVVVVGIDDKSLDRIGTWPFRRRLHAIAIRRLRAAGARVIAYNIQFTQPSEFPRDDDALIEAVRAAGNVVLATTAATNGETQVFGGGEGLEYSQAEVGMSSFEREADGFIRRVQYEADGLRSFALVAAGMASGRTYRPEDLGPDARGWIAFRGPAGTTPTISFTDLVAPGAKPPDVRGKTVVVGATARDLQDLHATGAGGPRMPGVEIHANAIATALADFPIRSASRTLDLALIFLLGVGVPLACLWLPPRRAALVCLGTAIAYLAIWQIALDRGTILTVVYPVAALLLAALAGLLVEARIPRALRRRRVATTPETPAVPHETPASP
jgi:CHASE2 domain-containing sensor protein